MDEQNNTPATTEQSAHADATPQVSEDTHTRSLVLVLAGLVVLLLLFGIYLWGSSMTSVEDIPYPEELPVPPTNPSIPTEALDELSQELPPLSPSDEVDALEADLNALDIDGLDAEFEALERELDAAAKSLEETSSETLEVQ